jgi:hypothetical protein
MIARRYRTPLALALMVAGVAVAVVGYLGVARETEVAFQLPYFASGAVGALMLLGAGAALLLSTQLEVDTGRLDELEDAVRTMAAELSRLADSTAALDVGAVSATVGRRRARPPARARSDAVGAEVSTNGRSR